jgi:replicative DNA helicase
MLPQNLRNPKNSFDKFDKEFQTNLIKALLTDKNFLDEIAELIRPEYFVSSPHGTLVDKILNHYHKFYGPPAIFELKAELTYIKNEDIVEQCQQIIGEIENKEVNLQYTKEKSLEFCKNQKMRDAIEKSTDYLAKEEYDKIRKIITEATQFDMKKDLGLSFDEDVKKILSTSRKTIGTGYNILDFIFNGGFSAGELCVICGGPSTGKCLAKGTKILMYDGTTKNVEDIKINDLVMGNDSTPRKVLSLHSGKGEMYKVSNINTKQNNIDIDSYIVNSEHILSLKIDDKNSIKKYCNPNSIYKKYYDGEFFNIPVKEYLLLPKGFQRKLKGCINGVEYEDKQVKISPYLLGVWLGNGSKHKFSVTTMDKEIVGELEKEASNSLMNDLNFYGLKHNKHIPFDYLVNSYKKRIQLLAGLIDVNGCKKGKSYSITTKYYSLALDISTLSRSLGFNTSISKNFNKKYNNIYYNVLIKGDCYKIPVLIPRKRLNKETKRTNSLNYGIKVDNIGIDNYYGFEVNMNNLFLLANNVVIHNSFALVNFGKRILDQGKNVLYITLELSEEVVMKRFYSLISKVIINDLEHQPTVVDNAIQNYKLKSGKLRIKNYPTKKASVQTINTFIETIGARENFFPDIIIIDYADIVKPLHKGEAKKRFELENVYEDLRALAVERKVPILTACFHGDTVIYSPIGKYKIKDLVGKSGFPVYSYDNEKKSIVLKTVKSVYKSGTNQDLMKVTLDNGKHIIVTPNHNFMLRDGSYCKVENLKIGDSLMPLKRRLGKDGRKEIYLNNGKWEKEYKLVVNWKFGNVKKGKHIHHKDLNKYNDNPNNKNIFKKREISLFGSVKEDRIQKIIEIIKNCNNKKESLEKIKNIPLRNSEKNELIKNYNCKVVSIEYYGKDDVYNMEVDDLHNYGLDAGIIVKNSQANKEGKKSEYVSMENMSESYAKAAISDIILGINRNPSGSEFDYGTCHISKNRGSGKDGYLLPVIYNTSLATIEIPADDYIEKIRRGVCPINIAKDWFDLNGVSYRIEQSAPTSGDRYAGNEVNKKYAYIKKKSESKTILGNIVDEFNKEIENEQKPF